MNILPLVLATRILVVTKQNSQLRGYSYLPHKFQQARKVILMKRLFLRSIILTATSGQAVPRFITSGHRGKQIIGVQRMMLLLFSRQPRARKGTKRLTKIRRVQHCSLHILLRFLFLAW